MSPSTRLPDTKDDKGASQTTRQPLSAPMLLFVTALDTTWRIFVPTLGGVFAGIGLDSVWGIAPIATIVCLIIGIIITIMLVTRQLINVRKP